MISRIALTVVTLLLTASCSTWVRVSGHEADSSQGYVVQLPEGWHKFNLTGQCHFLTKDGISLQQLIVQRLSRDEVLRNTERTLPENLLPQEVAEAVIADLSVDPTSVGSKCFPLASAPSKSAAFADFSVIENVPTTVGQYPGFKLVYTYRASSGLQRKAAHYGALAGDSYYYLHLDAPKRHYFEKDYPVLEDVKSSFRIQSS